jgi:hypothetical protein
MLTSAGEFGEFDCLLTLLITFLSVPQELKRRIPKWSALHGVDDEPPLLKLNASASSEQYKATEEATERLRAYYKPYNKKLAEFTGVAF